VWVIEIESSFNSTNLLFELLKYYNFNLNLRTLNIWFSIHQPEDFMKGGFSFRHNITVGFHNSARNTKTKKSHI